MVTQQNEGQAKRLALRGTVARLTAEANGRALEFPKDVAEIANIVDGETDAYNARRRALQEAIDSNRRNIGLLMKELGVAEAMSAKGLMSEVEVMRVRRQVNDLQLQNMRDSMRPKSSSGALTPSVTRVCIRPTIPLSKEMRRSTE